MKTYKIGLIGCGRIGTLLEEDKLRGKPCTHAGGFNAISSTKIVAGCDIDSSRLKKFGTRWNVDRLYKDYKKMLLQEKLGKFHLKILYNFLRNIILKMF